MATSGDLIKTVAAATKVPVVRTELYYRALREAGLTSKSGRGPRSSAQMSIDDAANLLLAMAGCNEVKDGPAQVPKLRACRRYGKSRWLDLPDTVGELMHFLIQSEIDGSMGHALRVLPRSAFPVVASREFMEGYGLKIGGPEGLGATGSGEGFEGYEITIDRGDLYIRVDVYRPSLIRANQVKVASYSPANQQADANPYEEEGLTVR